MKILKARFKLIIVDDMGVDDFAKINFTKLCPDKTQLSSARPNQRQCPEFLLHLKSTILRIPRWLPCGHPGSLACSQLLSCFRLPPEAARGAGTTIGLVVSRVIQSPAASCCACKGTSRCFPRSEREREKETLLEAMDHGLAQVMWPLERTDQHTFPVQVLSSSHMQERNFFVPWVYISFGYGMDWCFLRMTS